MHQEKIYNELIDILECLNTSSRSPPIKEKEIFDSLLERKIIRDGDMIRLYSNSMEKLYMLRGNMLIGTEFFPDGYRYAEYDADRIISYADRWIIERDVKP